MKKIISILTIMFLVSGCSCKKDEYKFASFSLEVGGENKDYTCSKKDKEDPSVKSMCEGFEGMKITFKDKDTLKVYFPTYEIEEEEDYKIEDGYLYLKDDGEWEKFAEYKDNKIIISYEYATVTLKK